MDLSMIASAMRMANGSTFLTVALNVVSTERKQYKLDFRIKNRIRYLFVRFIPAFVAPNFRCEYQTESYEYRPVVSIESLRPISVISRFTYPYLW